MTKGPNADASSQAGYHSFHNEDGEAYGSFYVQWIDQDTTRLEELEKLQDEAEDEASEGHAAFGFGTEEREELELIESMPSGWYWIAQFPGCMPDGDSPSGPFDTSEDARADADEYWDDAVAADHD